MNIQIENTIIYILFLKTEGQTLIFRIIMKK